MTDDRFTEARCWADNQDAWQEPARCDDWISIMREIANSQRERPEDRAEAELIVKRLEMAKRGPAISPGVEAYLG